MMISTQDTPVKEKNMFIRCGIIPVRDPFLDGYAHHYWYALDEKQLNEAAKHYIGSHDFTSFCTLDQRKMGDMVRTVTEAKVERAGDMVLFTVSADGFLYNMVRIIGWNFAQSSARKISAGRYSSYFGSKKQKNGGTNSTAMRIVFKPCVLLTDRVG